MDNAPRLGKIVKKISFTMADYDKCPPEIRHIIANCPYIFGSTKKVITIEKARVRVLAIMKKAALKAYGPDYPFETLKVDF